MRQLPVWMLLALAAQFVALIFFTYWYSVAGLGVADARALPPTTFHDSIALVVPFTAKDEAELIAALESWRVHPPCASQHGAYLHAEVFFYYNHDLTQDIRLKHAVHMAALSLRSHCFRQFHYVSARLNSADDKYDKKRLTDSWVSGPNSMFYRIFTRQDSELTRLLHPFRVILWLEPDVRPVRANWLVTWSLRTYYTPEFWIMGSAYAGECAEDTQGECRYLGPRISNHINGNAAYHYASDSFREFLTHRVLTGEYKQWPFDLAMYLQMHSSGTEPEQRQLLARYSYTNLIRNFGDFPYDIKAFGSEVTLVHGLHSNASSRTLPVVIPLPPQELMSARPQQLALSIDNLPNFFFMLTEHNSRDLLEVRGVHLYSFIFILSFSVF